MGSDDAFDKPPAKPLFGTHYSPNTPEPDPTPSEYPPAWPRVVAFLDQVVTDRPVQADEHTLKMIALVRADMLERDAHGREKYGQPIRAGNGRRHLVDLYQEKLDAIVYAQSWLDENGIDPMADLTPNQLTEDASIVLGIFANSITHVIALRGLIEGGN